MSKKVNHRTLAEEIRKACAEYDIPEKVTINETVVNFISSAEPTDDEKLIILAKFATWFSLI